MKDKLCKPSNDPYKVSKGMMKQGKPAHMEKAKKKKK